MAPVYFAYGMASALLFTLLALLSVLAVMLLPTLAHRRAATHRIARTYFVLAAMPLRIRGA